MTSTAPQEVAELDPWSTSSTPALAPARLRWPAANPVSCWLGDVSYGVHLWHAIINMLILVNLGARAASPPKVMLVYQVMVLPLSLLAGYVSRRFVEQPVFAWGRRITGRARGTVPELTAKTVAPVPA